MLTFCSITSQETLPQCRVLTAALLDRHPDARVSVLLIGAGPWERIERLEYLVPSDVAPATGADFSGAADGHTLSALRPLLLARVLSDGAEAVMYLAPEMYVYDSLDPVFALARERGIVVAPRLRVLPDDDKRPSYGDLIVAGRISDAFMALSAGRQSTEFLEWWSRRITEQQGANPHWLDLAADLFPSIAVLEDPGCNVSYWNLHECPITCRGGQLNAAGQPLRFIDFSGLQPDRPYWLNDMSTRVKVVDDPILAEITGEYCERVRDAGWLPTRSQPELTERFGNGLLMDDLTRTLWAKAVRAGKRFGDPSSPLAADAFAAWLREPGERGGAAGVNRYLLEVYALRPDLQQAFPKLDDAGATGLIAWAWQHGRRELGLAPELMPPAPDGLEVADSAPLAVNVVGFFKDTLGLAEAARLYITSLRAAGVPVSTTAIPTQMLGSPGAGSPVKRHGVRVHEELRSTIEPAFNFACMNGDHLDSVMRTNGEEVFGDRPTIGQWAWETDVLPPSWLPAFQHLEEIWVNSTFVAENLGRVAPIPVIVIPQAIAVPDPSGVTVSLMSDERFTFLFTLDFFSTLRRKNAKGLVDAFTRAFAPGEGPRLLIKTLNGEHRPGALADLHGSVGERPDVDLIDTYLAPAENMALLASADCYVSLHRSEGFGLTLAEAMALGTPVIATGYSGNTDFMAPHNSYLVDWTLTRIGTQDEIYPAEGRWAEPDLDHAAELMRRVWQRPEEARRKADRARRDIEERYAPQVTGRLARARLEHLVARRAGAVPAAGDGAAGATAAAYAAIDRGLAIDLRNGAPPAPRGLKGALRRLVLKTMLPFTYHERSLDQAIAVALRELRADFDREQALRVNDRVRLGRLEARLGREREQ